MLSKTLHLVLGIVLLSALVLGLRAAGPVAAAPETSIVKGRIVSWRGGADGTWSNRANWQDGAIPRANDMVRFPAGAPDALLDSSFGGVIGGISMDKGFQGTVTLARPLMVRGDLEIAGGTLNGGNAPLIIEGKATVGGGTLTTPGNTMSVTSLEIDAPGVVVMGANGKLNLTGDGTPLTGSGLLDTATHTPNSVEYTGHATTDLMTAGPASSFYALANVSGQIPEQPDRPSLDSREALTLASRTFTRTNSLPLNTGENNLYSAVIDTANGLAYFGTNTSPGIVVKVRLSDFTRVGALTLSSGENILSSSSIDAANGFAYFGTSTGIVVKVRLSDFTHAAALTLNAGEINLHSAVIDTANGFAYFGTYTSPGIVVKVKLSDFTRLGALTLSSGENSLVSAVIDTANGLAYFGTLTSPGIVVKVHLSDLTRVGALALNAGAVGLNSAVMDAANGFAYFGTGCFFPCNTTASVVKLRLSDFTQVGTLPLNTGENSLDSAVIDTANGYAYFGTGFIPPGIVVKVQLSNFTRVGAVRLNTGEDYLYSAVIDTVNNYAYFGTFTTPGIVVKVDLGNPPLNKRLYLPLIKR